MMNLDSVKEKILDFGRDIRLNLDSVLTPDGAPGLSPGQIVQVALSCAYAVEDPELIRVLEADAPGEIRDAAKGAATLMAMNNVYYRFLHLAEDAELSKLQARLRMNLIGKPGVPKVDFELMCLAVSAIAGCGSCIKSHVSEVKKAGISDVGVQSTVRIASVIQAAKRALYLSAVNER